MKKRSRTRSKKQPKRPVKAKGRPTKKRLTAPRLRRKIVRSKIGAASAVAKHSYVQPSPLVEGPADQRIPHRYGDHKIVLLVRDPWWLFAYWEISGSALDATLRRHGRLGQNYVTVLRVYDVTGLHEFRHNSFFDIHLNGPADQWYIDVGAPDREWVAEIGLVFSDGDYLTLVRSNRVRTPSFGVSDVMDEEWMLPDDIYFKILGRSVSPEFQGGSMDIRKLLEKYLKNSVSSERTTSPPSKGRA